MIRGGIIEIPDQEIYIINGKKGGPYKQTSMGLKILLTKETKRQDETPRRRCKK
jgi:hypothetical protein